MPKPAKDRALHEGDTPSTTLMCGRIKSQQSNHIILNFPAKVDFGMHDYICSMNGRQMD
jgi:hypothetical protein